MSGRFDRLEPAIAVRIDLVLKPQVDEKAIGAVSLWIGYRLAVDRDQALAALSGRFSDQLLGPGAEVGKPRRAQQRDLVAAETRGKSERETELGRRIGAR